MRYPLALVLTGILLANYTSPIAAQDNFNADSPSNQLAAAIDSGSVAAVRRLLDAGVPPNTLVYETPPLMWATWEERYYVVKLLLDRGADVNLPDEDGYTVLMSACSMGNERIVKLLLESKADTNAIEATYGMSALQSACEAGDDKIVDLLIDRGAKVTHTDKYGGNCLEEAAFNGHKTIVEKLRAKGLTSEWTLHVACGLGDIEQVKRLLAEGAKADQPNTGWKNTPMMFAAGGGHVEVAKILIENGATLDTKNVLGAGPLHVSASSDSLEFAKWAVGEGVDVNALDADRSTPLDWADEHVYDFLEANGAEHSAYEPAENANE